jgi:hypothetical protein
MGRLLLAILACLPVSAGAADATPTAQALSPSARAESPEAFIAAAVARLDAELGLLDGGSLTGALKDQAASGRPLRLLLDPGNPETRREGSALAALSPSVQVRWMESAGRPHRRLLVDGARQMLWRPGGDATRADAAVEVALQRFEAAWAAAMTSLPSHLRLEDQLQSLPDPREQTPHIIRRKDSATKEATTHEDDQDP